MLPWATTSFANGDWSNDPRTHFFHQLPALDQRMSDNYVYMCAWKSFIDKMFLVGYDGIVFPRCKSLQWTTNISEDFWCVELSGGILCCVSFWNWLDWWDWHAKREETTLLHLFLNLPWDFNFFFNWSVLIMSKQFDQKSAAAFSKLPLRVTTGWSHGAKIEPLLGALERTLGGF